MSPSIKHGVIGAGFAAIAASRADRWLAGLARGLGSVLMFHHVRPASTGAFRPNALLEITPEHLDRTLHLVRALGHEIVPLDAVPGRIRDGHGSFVALTFDDGYRDNVEHALPILRRHAAPWTLFVTTDFAAGRGRLWWVELEEVVRASERLDLDGIGIACRTDAEKNAAFERIYRNLRAGPESRLRDVIGRWCEKAGIDTCALTRRLCLPWPEIVALADERGVTIGAHTTSHPMLAKHDPEIARLEIVEGRAELARRLGREIRHLAYPVGDPGSAARREFAIARQEGFATAVTTRPGHVFAGHAEHLTALPRVSMNGLHQSEAATRALLSGLPFLAWNRGRRINVA